MPKRKTPRPPEEALAISRALRKKFISPEAEATAKRLLAEQAAKTAEKPFSDREMRRAAESCPRYAVNIQSPTKQHRKPATCGAFFNFHL